MAGVSNIVELLFRVSDQASGPSRNIASSFEGLKGSAMAAAAATATVGAGVLAVAKQAIDLGSKFEDTSINIAGNIRAFQLAPTFDAATKAAAGALDTIEAMAAKLPGETDQYVEVFKIALPKAIESGMNDIKAITDLTSRFTAVAVAGGVDAGQAGMNLFRMLAGQAGADVNMFTMLAPHLKMTAVQFNKLSMEARRLAIDKALGNFAEMMEAAGNTFSSKMGEAQSHLKTLVRLAGRPIFTAAVEQLGKMNEWFGKNEKLVLSMGETIATKLVSGIKTLIDNFETLYKVGKNLVEVFIAFKAGVIAMELVNGLMLIVKAFQAIRTAAVGAAAAEAFATGGVSALVGAAAAAGVFAAFKISESESGFTAPVPKDSPADSWMRDFEKKAQRLAPALGLSKFARRDDFGQPIIPLDMGRNIVKIFGEEMDKFKGAQLAGFLAFAKKYGVDVEGAPAVGKPPKAPGGPKKADVIIENARFDIKQSFAEGFDPDRIAAAFVEQIGSTALYQGQSSFAAAGTGA